MKHLLNAGIAFLSLSLAGCDLHSPTTITEKRVQVREEAFMQDVVLSDVDDSYVGGLARHYTKYGGSPMDLIITYDPKSYRNTAMKATSEVANIIESLRDYGVTDVNAGVMPIKSQGDKARLLISYDAFTAHAPDGCDKTMPGMNRTLEGDPDYKLGCSIETILARQVAKPSHLLGRGADGGTTDGRSAANIVDAYRMGEQNSPLGGESSTE